MKRWKLFQTIVTISIIVLLVVSCANNPTESDADYAKLQMSSIKQRIAYNADRLEKGSEKYLITKEIPENVETVAFKNAPISSDSLLIRFRLLSLSTSKENIYEVTYLDQSKKLSTCYLTHDLATDEILLNSISNTETFNDFMVVTADTGGGGGGGGGGGNPPTPVTVTIGRFYVHANYQGSCLTATHSVATTGSYIRYYGNLMDQYYNDCISSHGEVSGSYYFPYYDENRYVNPYKLMVYKDADYGNPYYYFEDMGSDSNWSNEYWGLPAETINDRVSSMKICFSVY